MEARKFKIGDKVFDIRYGWGRVLLDEFTEDYINHPICVIFNKGKMSAYTKDGKDSITDINPILSHTEYSTQSEYPKQQLKELNKMKEPKRYSCGNGEGMFEDDKNGDWVEYSEHKAIVEALTEQLRQYNVSGQNKQFKCEKCSSDWEQKLIGKNIHSVFTWCKDCHSEGVNIPLNDECGNCGSKNTVRYYDKETIDLLF